MTPAEILFIRQQLGLSQTDLCRILGTAFPTVSRWEQGHNEPKGISTTILRGLLAVAEHVRSGGALDEHVLRSLKVGGIALVLVEALKGDTE